MWFRDKTNMMSYVMWFRDRTNMTSYVMWSPTGAQNQASDTVVTVKAAQISRWIAGRQESVPVHWSIAYASLTVIGDPIQTYWFVSSIVVLQHLLASPREGGLLDNRLGHGVLINLDRIRALQLNKRRPGNRSTYPLGLVVSNHVWFVVDVDCRVDHW